MRAACGLLNFGRELKRRTEPSRAVPRFAVRLPLRAEILFVTISAPSQSFAQPARANEDTMIPTYPVQVRSRVLEDKLSIGIPLLFASSVTRVLAKMNLAAILELFPRAPKPFAALLPTALPFVPIHFVRLVEDGTVFSSHVMV